MTSRYAAAHKSPNGPGDERPTAIQIIDDEGLRGKLKDKTMLITGCSSGIGVETVKALFLTGAKLYLTARNLAKAKEALGALAEDERICLLHLDLNSFASVRSCADEFLTQSKTLNVLICNAGVMTPPEGRTEDGFETQFGTNHLAHFLLFNLLQPTLIASTGPEFASRVVILSSVGHRFGKIPFDNVNFEGNYDAMQAYSSSKTANLWTANEIERRFGKRGLHAWSVQPGAVLTDLMRHMSADVQSGLQSDEYLSKIFKYPNQGAATSVWAAISASLEGKGGKYLEDCQIAEPWDPSSGTWTPGYGSHAYDEEDAQVLWSKSLEWTGL